MNVLVLAGGGGTRLWPLSRQDFPKQFLYFNSPLSLLQKTVSRFLTASFVERIAVATNEQYRALVEMQLEKIDAHKKVEILVEPARRNTAAAIALGVKYFEEQANKESAILVMPSDHLIEPESVFLRFLEEAQQFVEDERIILFGIRPHRAETGYGYIQIGEKDKGFLYRVKRFVEKPDQQRAEQYLSSGDYYWNAGIFAFSPRTFWKELAYYEPEMYEKMQGDLASCLAQFSSLPDRSIDYAILEKTKQIAVCPLPISWSDIGSWDSVYEISRKDANQNVKAGNVFEIDTKNCLIIAGKKMISLAGVEDLLVIDTDDAIFISKRGESQKVKELVQELAKQNRKEVCFIKPN